MRNHDTMMKNIRKLINDPVLLKEYLEEDWKPRNPANHCPMYKYGIRDITNIRKFPELDSGMRCVTITHSDIQSGPFYCGNDAYLIGESKNEPGICYVLCKEHARKYGLI